MNRFVKSNQSVNEGLGMDIASNLAGAASFLPMGRGAKSALRGLAALGMLSSADSGIDEVPVGSGFDAASAARGAAAAGWAMGALGGLRKKPIPVPAPNQPMGRVNVRVRPFVQEPPVIRRPKIVPGQIPNLKITDPNRLLPQLNAPTVANLARREFPNIPPERVPGSAAMAKIAPIVPVLGPDFKPLYKPVSRERLAATMNLMRGLGKEKIGPKQPGWIMPGSRLRPEDRQELASFRARYAPTDREIIGADARGRLALRKELEQSARDDDELLKDLLRKDEIGSPVYVGRAARGQGALIGDNYTPELMHNVLMESMSGYCKKKI